MKITKIGLANFRSFDSEGATFSKPGKINLIIGKNNSGKSNFLRFLRLLAETSADLKRFPSRNIENQFRRKNVNTELIIGFDPKSHYTGTIVQTYFNDIDEVVSRIDITEGKVIKCSHIDDFPVSRLSNLQGRYSGGPKNRLLEVVYEELFNNFKKAIAEYTKLVYIPHFREVGANSTRDDKSKIAFINGEDIVNRLFTMQSPKLGDERDKKKFDLIQKYVRDLINESELKIEIPHNKDRIIINLHGNRLSLEAFGTGIHELVIMCMAIAIHDDHIICIEEPELHLHPELQRKFIEFLQKTDNKYFITTHSNVFLDYKSDVNIYHVKYDKHKSSVSRAITSEDSYGILDDLAYKASDLLQSNGVIWVEGPSDRIYLNRWIEIVNPTLKEGIHYSIMFYGGRPLSHLSLKSEFFQENLIPLLKINRNAFVMIDRDGFSSDNKLNETKRRINAETKIKNCWITKGREIENYLTEATIKKYFKNKNGKSINFSHSPKTKLGAQIKSKNKDLRFNYSNDKVGYSKEIIKHIDKEDLKIMDLNRKLVHLNKEILSWNNIEDSES